MTVTSPPFQISFSSDDEKLIYIYQYMRGTSRFACLSRSLYTLLPYIIGSSSVMLTGQWSLPIWLAWMWALVMRGAIAADASQ